VGDRTEARLGSVEEVLSGSYSITQAPLVLANILAPVILRLFDDGLAGLVSKDGYLVLAGILAEQVPEVLDGVARHGMGLSKQKQVGDWVGLAVHHQGH
jgi:ribosomal protein L11 methyltransferase